MFVNMDEYFFRTTAGRIGISIDSRTTIGDVFQKADDIRNTAWKPCNPLEEYRDSILGAYELYKAPLFGMFKEAFPGRSEPQEIIEAGHRCGLE